MPGEFFIALDIFDGYILVIEIYDFAILIFNSIFTEIQIAGNIHSKSVICYDCGKIIRPYRLTGNQCTGLYSGTQRKRFHPLHIDVESDRGNSFPFGIDARNRNCPFISVLLGLSLRIGAKIVILYRPTDITYIVPERVTRQVTAEIYRTGERILYALLVIGRIHPTAAGNDYTRYNVFRACFNLGQRYAARSSTAIYGRDERVRLTGSKKPALLQREGVVIGRKHVGAAIVIGCHRYMLFKLFRLHARFEAADILRLYRKLSIVHGILRHLRADDRCAQRQDEQYCGAHKDDGTKDTQQQFSFDVHKKTSSYIQCAQTVRRKLFGANEKSA